MLTLAKEQQGEHDQVHIDPYTRGAKGRSEIMRTLILLLYLSPTREFKPLLSLHALPTATWQEAWEEGRLLRNLRFSAFLPRETKKYLNSMFILWHCTETAPAFTATQ